MTLVALACGVSCKSAAARVGPLGGAPASEPASGGGGTAGAPGGGGESREEVAGQEAEEVGRDVGGGAGSSGQSARVGVLARMVRLNRSERFLFGQQNATLWGMYLNGGLVSTGSWFENTARAGRFTSDSEMVVGDHPAVLGVGLDMLAFEPTQWNRRAAVAEAIRRHVAQGGVVTMDWHAPSCDASVRAEGVLASVKVNGVKVAIQSVRGGSLFYAEEEYTRPIASRADVPEALKCLCQIANDAPLTAGPYKGTKGRTWLIAHAKHAARVLRDEGLAALPIIVRPFHEHTGSWFWWGQPYWNCAALLDNPDAVSGPEAYKAVARLFVSTLRSEPGITNLLFAYSPGRLDGPNQEERFTRAQNKVMDPSGHARDILRARLVRELDAAGLGYTSPIQSAATVRAPRVTSGRQARAYVAQRRAYYAEAYAGDDIFDVLGIDLYHPIARAANRADLEAFRLQLRALAEEARARRKPYALTEAGTYRLQLEQLSSRTATGRDLRINGKSSVDEALARLFDPSDRAALLRHFGLAAAGPISLDGTERSAVVPKVSEDWFNEQLLVLAKEAKVAYALVWQTYYDSSAVDRYFHYYIPYPGHPDEPSFQRFYKDPATCFLRDACGY
jgi:Glycosyl hydrolase family 26